MATAKKAAAPRKRAAAKPKTPKPEPVADGIVVYVEPVRHATPPDGIAVYVDPYETETD